jgi:transposase InsO family protein
VRIPELRPEIKRVWDENYQVYGVRKAWHQMKREGFEMARCTVERLMKQIGIRGAVRGKVVKTTVPDTSVPCPRDKVNRIFRAPAPNLLRPFSDAKGGAERVTGQRLHLCVHLAGLCLCCLRRRYVR